MCVHSQRNKKLPCQALDRASRGFTLVEVLVVVAIAAILTAMAIPSFSAATQNSRMVSEANNLLGAMNYSRTEAIRRGNNVLFGRRNGTDWNGGFVAWIDADSDNSWDAGEEIRLWEPLHSSMSLSSGSTLTLFTFNSAGLVNMSNTVTLTLCDNRTGETGRTLTLLISGMSYLSEVTCS